MAQHKTQPSTANAGTDPEQLLQTAITARAEGDMAAAANALDMVLQAVPGHPIPLRLRARVALQRAETDALARFDAALKADPGNADLHLGKAQALEIAGDFNGAMRVAEQIAAQAPGFIAALSFLSSLYLARGREDFAAPFAQAMEKAPQDPNIAAAYCDAFAGIERFEDAAKIAVKAQQRFPEEPHFAFLEASYAGSMGDWNRAEAIFATLPSPSAPTPNAPTQNLQRWLAEARHRLRAGDIAATHILLDKAIACAPDDVAAWALKGLAWRLGDTPEDKARTAWLHEQAGLVQLRPLEAPKSVLDKARSLLRDLHESAGMPLSQSLRGGSQTRGILFHRCEIELSELHQAIGRTLEAYRESLPPSDAAHPLLKHRDSLWQLAGSWSVRLLGGGDHHAAHIHPAGLISSALYCKVPEQANEQEQQGWLEIGRPPADLGLGLEPLATLQPKEGHLALFPSTLYHGTTPFPANATTNERMSVAFDIITKIH